MIFPVCNIKNAKRKIKIPTVLYNINVLLTPFILFSIPENSRITNSFIIFIPDCKA